MLFLRMQGPIAASYVSMLCKKVFLIIAFSFIYQLNISSIIAQNMITIITKKGSTLNTIFILARDWNSLKRNETGNDEEKK